MGAAAAGGTILSWVIIFWIATCLTFIAEVIIFWITKVYLALSFYVVSRPRGTHGWVTRSTVDNAASCACQWNANAADELDIA